ncbi:hypothetical protein ACFLTP_05410 [Chloroflexota bacterium]
MKLGAKTLISIVAILLVVSAVVVWVDNNANANSSNENVICACLNPAGQIRIVESAEECRPQETPLQWSIVGSAGNPGPQGEPGSDGVNCWDLNGNGIADPEEDLNGDSQVNVLDCNGEQGDPGAPGPAGPTGPAGQGFDLECEFNQVAKYNAYAECWQCANEGEVVGDLQVFTSDGTFTVPEGINRILVEVWGAGGGGGYPSQGQYLCPGGGGGGGSGGYSERLLDLADGQVFNIVTGVGGSPNQAGDSSSITDTSGSITPIVAGGGEGGSNATTTGCGNNSENGCAGARGAGGSGETSNGNNGANGQNGQFVVYGCQGGDAGNGGSAINGTITPSGSSGGRGGQAKIGATFGPSTGQNGYVLIRW